MNRPRTAARPGSSYSPDTNDASPSHDELTPQRSRRATLVSALLSKPYEFIAFVTIIGAALGFRFLTPSAQVSAQVTAEATERIQADAALKVRVDSNRAAIDSLRREVTSIKGQLNGLGDQLTFTNYMQCLQTSRVGISTPGDVKNACTQIIQRRLAPQ